MIRAREDAMIGWHENPEGKRVLVLPVSSREDEFTCDHHELFVVELDETMARDIIGKIQMVQVMREGDPSLLSLTFLNDDGHYIAANYDDGDDGLRDEPVPNYDIEGRTDGNHLVVGDRWAQWTAYTKHGGTDLYVENLILGELRAFVAGQNPWPHLPK